MPIYKAVMDLIGPEPALKMCRAVSHSEPPRKRWLRGVLSYSYLSTFSLQMSNDLAGSFVRERFPCLSKGRIETATKVSLQAGAL